MAVGGEGVDIITLHPVCVNNGGEIYDNIMELERLGLKCFFYIHVFITELVYFFGVGSYKSSVILTGPNPCVGVLV